MYDEKLECKFSVIYVTILTEESFFIDEDSSEIQNSR